MSLEPERRRKLWLPSRRTLPRMNTDDAMTGYPGSANEQRLGIDRLPVGAKLRERVQSPVPAMSIDEAMMWTPRLNRRSLTLRTKSPLPGMLNPLEPAAPEAPTPTIYIMDDSFISAAPNADQNYGGSEYLYIQQYYVATPNSDIMLRFSAPLEEFYMFAYQGWFPPTVPLWVAGVSDNWHEYIVTWNNAPSYVGQNATERYLPTFAGWGWIRFDWPSGGYKAVRILNHTVGQGNLMRFRSKEYLLGLYAPRHTRPDDGNPIYD